MTRNEKQIIIKSSAGRLVYIEFASDPDIVVREKMAKDTRNIVAIEIKGGTDFSNIHNRIGEAEKSHQKARLDGFVECWTVVNVDNMNMETAKRESPSTDRFYKISEITKGAGEAFEDFRSRLISISGIPD